MYGDVGCVRIQRAENGYSLTMTDPAIVRRNRSRDLSSDRTEPYTDPDKTYVFQTYDALSKFLGANLDKALPKSDFGTSFDEIVDAPDGDMS